MEIKICRTLGKRFLGLMGKQGFDYGLCFPRCNSIHTFFMREDIDIIITNKEHKIIFIKKNMKKNRIILPVQCGYYTYEFPCSIVSVMVGDYFNPLSLKDSNC